MRIEICHVGKTREAWVKSGEEYFVKKCKRFSGIRTQIIRGSRSPTASMATQQDSAAILDFLKKNPREYNILLDERGTMRDSIEFARHLEHISMHKGGAIRFITGGPFGVTGEVREACDELMSISPMVFHT